MLVGISDPAILEIAGSVRFMALLLDMKSSTILNLGKYLFCQLLVVDFVKEYFLWLLVSLFASLFANCSC